MLFFSVTCSFYAPVCHVVRSCFFFSIFAIILSLKFVVTVWTDSSYFVHPGIRVRVRCRAYRSHNAGIDHRAESFAVVLVGVHRATPGESPGARYARHCP